MQPKKASAGGHDLPYAVCRMWRASASTTSKHTLRRPQTTEKLCAMMITCLCVHGCVVYQMHFGEQAQPSVLLGVRFLATAAAAAYCAWLVAGRKHLSPVKNVDLRISASMRQVTAEAVCGASDTASDVKDLGGGKHQEEGAADVLHGLLGHVLGQHIAAQDG